MKYAVIKNGGHQYKVEEGQIIKVEKLDSDGKSYVFEEVLLSVDSDKVELGEPTISGLKVYADIVSEVKGDKIEVFKYKSKSRYRKHTGHRQKYTQIKIVGIGTNKPAPIGAQHVSPVKPKKVVARPVTTKPKAKSDRVTTKPKGRSVKKPASK